MTDYLKTIITSKLDDTGFTEFFNNTKKAESSVTGLSNKFGDLNGIVGLGIKAVGGFFAVNKLVGEYNKAVQLSNYQLEQETKLQSTLKAQGFRQEQIQSIKDYASALQQVGVIGDEVTLAGAQQLATYNLTEENLKALLPAMQDIMVQQKGVNATGQDAVAVANMLAKGLQGQLGKLEMSGITLTEQEKKMIKYGNQQERVLALVKAVKENVGEQNKEFLKTPEGKIASAGNRIGDVYEEIGAIFREVRAGYHTSMADTLEFFKPLIKGVASGLANAFDTLQNVTRGVFNLFKDMPPELKIGLGAIAGFFAITTFPVVAGLLAVEDFIGALQGKDSVIASVVDKLTEMAGIDFKMGDLFNAISMLGEPLDTLNDRITLTYTLLKGTIELLKGAGKGTLAIVKKVLGGATDLLTFDTDFTNFKEWGNDDAIASSEHFGEAWKTTQMYGKKKAIDEENKQIQAMQDFNEQKRQIEQYPAVKGLRLAEEENPLENLFTSTPNITNTENQSINNFVENIKKENINNFVENKENNISKINPINTNTSSIVFNSTPTINITGGETGNITDKIQQIIEMENKKSLNEMKVKLGGAY